MNGQRAGQLRLDLCNSQRFRRKERPLLTYSLLAVTPEQVNPECTLTEQSWFHGRINRLDAEKLLRNCKAGSYLVRHLESNQVDFALSVKCVRGFLHIKITTQSDGQFTLAHERTKFRSVPALVHFYSENRLPIKGAEHMALLFPLEEQLL